MRARIVVPLSLLFAHTVSCANIEWPVLYALRAVEFTEALVRECNASFPIDAAKRRTAFLAWKIRNQTVATGTRSFNIERVRKEDPKLDLAGMERDLDELERSALSQALKAKESWETMCKDMTRWLASEESDVERQIPDFMQAK